MLSLVLGTAGHIDHGKSSLVEALTGTDPDRLAEEKARGITIELGFAQLTLPSGRVMGVVDVPGHEKFVRHMVAGATGIDVALFVVAADDGIMPQTREHLAIIDILGVSKAVVALTKADLVDAEWIELVTEEINKLLAGTSIEGAEVVAVSAKTKAGLSELLAALDRIADVTSPRQAAMPMRLPVDRVFTISGAGTVVTGTLWSGSAARDDPVEIYPGGLAGRVRGVQVHSAIVDRAQAGQRVALNISGIDTDEIARGDVVAASGSLSATDRFDARFTYLGLPGSDRSFESGSRVHVHHGTREVLGRVLLVEGDTLAPGESSFAQVRLEEVLMPRYADRFIVRSYSPVYTIGGGMVLDASPPRRTNLKDQEIELLRALDQGDLARASLLLLAARGIPMTSAETAFRLGVAKAIAADAFNRADLKRLKAGGETWFVTQDALHGMVKAIERSLLDFHSAEPKATGIATGALRDLVDRRIPFKVFDAVLEEAAAAKVVIVEGGRTRHPTAGFLAIADMESAAATLISIVQAQGLSPASLAELAAEAGVDIGAARGALGNLAKEGRVVRLGNELHFSAEAMELARGRLVTLLRERGRATAAEIRDALGVSRKYVIPLLEHFDAQGLTVRDKDYRLLRKS